MTAGAQWDGKKYVNVKHQATVFEDASNAGWLPFLETADLLVYDS